MNSDLHPRGIYRGAASVACEDTGLVDTQHADGDTTHSAKCTSKLEERRVSARLISNYASSIVVDRYKSHTSSKGLYSAAIPRRYKKTDSHKNPFHSSQHKENTTLPPIPIIHYSLSRSKAKQSNQTTIPQTTNISNPTPKTDTRFVAAPLWLVSLALAPVFVPVLDAVEVKLAVAVAFN
jgi:hypothetical protein